MVMKARSAGRCSPYIDWDLDGFALNWTLMTTFKVVLQKTS